MIYMSQTAYSVSKWLYLERFLDSRFCHFLPDLITTLACVFIKPLELCHTIGENYILKRPVCRGWWGRGGCACLCAREGRREGRGVERERGGLERLFLG
jgi:hypothetical protein